MGREPWRVVLVLFLNALILVFWTAACAWLTRKERRQQAALKRVNERLKEEELDLCRVVVKAWRTKHPSWN